MAGCNCTPLGGTSPYLSFPSESAIHAFPGHPSARADLNGALTGVQAKFRATQGGAA